MRTRTNSSSDGSPSSPDQHSRQRQHQHQQQPQHTRSPRAHHRAHRKNLLESLAPLARAPVDEQAPKSKQNKSRAAASHTSTSVAKKQRRSPAAPSTSKSGGEPQRTSHTSSTSTARRSPGGAAGTSKQPVPPIGQLSRIPRRAVASSAVAKGKQPAFMRPQLPTATTSYTSAPSYLHNPHPLQQQQQQNRTSKSESKRESKRRKLVHGQKSPTPLMRQSYPPQPRSLVAYQQMSKRPMPLSLPLPRETVLPHALPQATALGGLTRDFGFSTLSYGGGSGGGALLTRRTSASSRVASLLGSTSVSRKRIVSDQAEEDESQDVDDAEQAVEGLMMDDESFSSGSEDEVSDALSGEYDHGGDERTVTMDTTMLDDDHAEQAYDEVEHDGQEQVVGNGPSDKAKGKRKAGSVSNGTPQTGTATESGGGGGNGGATSDMRTNDNAEEEDDKLEYSRYYHVGSDDEQQQQQQQQGGEDAQAHEGSEESAPGGANEVEHVDALNADSEAWTETAEEENAVISRLLDKIGRSSYVSGPDSQLRVRAEQTQQVRHQLESMLARVCTDKHSNKVVHAAEALVESSQRVSKGYAAERASFVTQIETLFKEADKLVEQLIEIDEELESLHEEKLDFLRKERAALDTKLAKIDRKAKTEVDAKRKQLKAVCSDTKAFMRGFPAVASS